MSIYHIDAQNVKTDHLIISGALHYHLTRVLRLKPLMSLRLSDQEKYLYEVQISSITKTQVIGKITAQEVIPPAPFNLTLGAALLKGESFGRVVRQATELGVRALQPLLTEYTVVDLDSREAVKKLERWRAVAAAAANQAERPALPAISSPAALHRFCLASYDLVLAGFTRENAPSIATILSTYDPDILPKLKIALLIGPEGGFALGEKNYLRAHNVQPVKLAPYILRAETANTVATGQVAAFFSSYS